MRILVTGAAGFIGFHLSKRLICEGFPVIGFDNINNYYDVNLKKERIKILEEISKKEKVEFVLIKNDLANNEIVKSTFKKYKPEVVINLAAQAGVRYSIDNPSAYINSNLVGFGNIIEAARRNKIKHFLYASSSSVYGGNVNLPFSESENVDHPVSLYGATKKSNELIAHSYSHLYQLPTTGLRFFTVYGPWGRPDMALFLFTKAILKGEPINVFNNGDMIRDFTYIDDVIESIYRLIPKFPEPEPKYDKKDVDPSNSWSPYKIFNVGNSKSVKLMDYIKCLEKKLNSTAEIINLPMQMGDVKSTEANTKLLESWIGFKPNTSIESGINSFVNWYKEFYKIS